MTLQTRPAFIYKILLAEDWQADMRIVPATPLDIKDGFIHLSAMHQIDGVLKRHFAPNVDLICLRFSCQMLRQQSDGDFLRWEISGNGDLFPHFYGNLLASWIDLHYPMANNQASRNTLVRHLQERELDEPL